MTLLRVAGAWACFTRPELKVEAVTYDVMTPTAATAILESIYWKPEIEWVIDGIHVLNPIKTMTLMRNGITSKISSSKNAWKIQPMEVEKVRDQRNATILRDVDYVIKAHFNIVSGEKNPMKHQMMFLRRATRGQCFRYPYFGCREFSVDSFVPVKEVPPSALKGTRNLGYMLHSIDYSNMRPAFFEAVIEDGYMSVPPSNSSRVKR